MLNAIVDTLAPGRRRRRAAAEAVASAARRGVAFPYHHHIFDAFAPFAGDAPLDVHVCYIGDRIHVDFLDWPVIRKADYVWPKMPAYDEEYFEWIDILEAVDAADDVFTMLELGAGFGRWSARGAVAARQRGKAAMLGLAEAEPKHVAWIHRNMADNAVPKDGYRIFEAAVTGAAGQTAFCVAKPADMTTEWFGQAVVPGDLDGRPVLGDYHGRPLIDVGEGFGAISVPTVPLSEILAQYGPIDIADFDLQGSEADAVDEAIRPLTRQVRRLHIGTHGQEIEERLRRTLSAAGWVCLRDYGVGQTNETSFGALSFVDGVQSWINPRRL